MPSLHINAQAGDFADPVLMPGESRCGCEEMALNGQNSSRTWSLVWDRNKAN